MEIHGKNRKFMLTVGAAIEIAALCPDGDIRKVGEIIGGTNAFGKMSTLTADIICALSKGYEQSKAYEENTPLEEPLSRAEVLSLKTEDFIALRNEAFAAFIADSTISVEAEQNTKKKLKA